MSSLPKEAPQPIPESSHIDAEGWERRERLNKNEAERLLDWLEANGCSQKEVSLAEDGNFTVRWRARPR
jgi:hypothetical protein